MSIRATWHSIFSAKRRSARASPKRSSATIGDSPSSAAVVWLGYPLVYAAYSLIHGAVTGFYPYPFINVSNLGYDKLLINMAVLVLVFLGLGLASASTAAWAAATSKLPARQPDVDNGSRR
jgi:hypothetical protein